MIIIINQSVGVSGTGVARELSERLGRSVMIDALGLGVVHPTPSSPEAWQGYLFRTLTHLVAFHRDNGYDRFVVHAVIEEVDALSRLVHRLRDEDEDIRVFRIGPLPSPPSRTHALGVPVGATGLSVRETADALLGAVLPPVELVDHDPAWIATFEEDAAKICEALGRIAIGVHHIGSTAVPGLRSTPIVDILVSLEAYDALTGCIAPLEGLGYDFIERPSMGDRHLFSCGVPRTHQIYVVEGGSQSVEDHLAFRDALKGNTPLRARYQSLKEDLAGHHRQDRAAYNRGKSEFIRGVLESLR